MKQKRRWDMAEHEDELRAWAKGCSAGGGDRAADPDGVGRPRAAVGAPCRRRARVRDLLGDPRHDRRVLRGEQRLLMIAASLGADQDAPVKISLEEELPGLDREHAQLVLAAIAHAAGFHQPGRSIELVDETPRLVDVDALYTWPSTDA